MNADLEDRIRRIESRLTNIEKRLKALEERTAGNVFVGGPQIEPENQEKIIKDLLRDAEKMVKKAKKLI